MIKENSHGARGFTLIELMVSVAIFAIIMVISLGALLSIAAANRKAETIASVMNNLNFAVEGMTRSIRTGYDYHCGTVTGGDCTSGGTYFKFTAQDGSQVVYAYANDAANCGQTGAVMGCIMRSTDGGTTYLPITAPEVIITNASTGTGLTFYLRGSTLGNLGDNVQPNVVITVTGYIQISATQKTPFALQTSVTQRLYDR
ncbi:MAG TPA: type II secretion system protein [Candidatus Paceibacterota bacterium]|nr:type II secretion system protein [Candidatus Paceibacterota bacterium]